MSEKHQFHASVDQYKKQFAKWKWSKYVPAKAGNWMLQKADQRKRDEGKDTEFEFRGRLLTGTSIQRRIEQKKGGLHSQGPLDAETPSDIKYATPSNPLSSPQEYRSAAMRIAQPTWAPPAKFDRRTQPQVRLVWNGRTKADYQAQYEEALGEERSGRPDEAEAKFRSALEGLDHLLSTTHPETVAVAYRLASFFAEHVRMQDADTVLDWLNQSHLEDFGLNHTRTLDHILNVCDMFRNWGRPEQAADLLQQVLREADKEPARPDSTYPLTANTSQYTNETNSQETANFHGEEHNLRFSMPSEGPVAPSTLQTRISQLTRGSEVGEDTEAVLLRLIKHCEQYPDKLLVHSLLCYPILLSLYEDSDDVVKKSVALEQAEKAVWTVLQSENKRTRDDLVACLQLSKHLVRAARYESADEIFSQIECDAQETFGSNHLTTIWFLENIGTFYQNEGRWQDAVSRFEHALAARLSHYDERHESVRRLEDALENHHFETYVPSSDKETFEYAEPQRPIRRVIVPEFVVLGPRPRGRQLD
ncbi:hypothetical protein N0V90_004999 [Kalmusia sp. IMI 367209]|nr:hypothetical protein N0V90_004999 [Kalmusia sp. IMI 367209]